jgi:hypothetical protein
MEEVVSASEPSVGPTVHAESTSRTESKYGPTGDGGYNTPYSVTVFYRGSEIFQVAVAALSEMCQAIPVIPGADLLILGETCEHPSPDLILFDDIEYTEEHFQKYFKRGFQRIHIFSRQNTNIMDALVEPTEALTANTVPTTNAAPNARYVSLANLDSRIQTFTLDNMNEGHVKLISNLTTVYIMDMIICGVYSEYKSFIRTITHERGRELIDYLQHTCVSYAHIGATLIRLATQFNGYEHAEELCAKWRGMREERQILARSRVKSSPVIDERLYVFGGDLRNEIIALAVEIDAKYIVVWYVANGIKVNVLKGKRWTEGDKTPTDLLTGFVGECVNNTTEYTLTDVKFLPFLQ